MHKFGKWVPFGRHSQTLSAEVPGLISHESWWINIDHKSHEALRSQMQLLLGTEDQGWHCMTQLWSSILRFVPILSTITSTWGQMLGKIVGRYTLLNVNLHLSSHLLFYIPKLGIPTNATMLKEGRYWQDLLLRLKFHLGHHNSVTSSIGNVAL